VKRMLLLLVLASGASALFCYARSRDYVFGVTGVVTGEDGTPLQGAEVILDVSSTVYDGVAPVKGERRLTNSTGGFVFMYTSHRRGVKYTVTARKEGFEPQTVSGSAPPDGHHIIRLKKAGGISSEDKKCLSAPALAAPTRGADTYDIVGNRLSSFGVWPYTYNSSNELVSLPSCSYTYDNNGNTTSKPDGTQYNLGPGEPADAGGAAGDRRDSDVQVRPVRAAGSEKFEKWRYELPL
jgi:hypothetical protein